MLVTPDATVWRGDRSLPDEEQGIIIQFTPVGKPEYIFHKLTQKSGVHAHLLERIPAVEDLQAAWLLLLFCAAAKSNFLLRTVSPLLTHRYAASHDAQLWRCFSSILRVTDATTPGVAKVIASLPSKGGLGLRSAVRLRFAAHWGQLGRLPSHGEGPPLHALTDDGESIGHGRPFSHHPSCLVLRAHTS